MRTCLFVHVLVFLPFWASACQPDEAAASGATAAGTGSTTTDEPPTTGATPEPTTGATTGTTGDLTTGAPTSTTSTADATTGEGGPYCGDGSLDPGEACDAGPDNADDGACTVQCTLAACGDGLVWAGVEACDFGDGNSDQYGGCDACQWGPRCGDAVVDAGHEECDLGDLNGTGVAGRDQGACTATCNWQGRLVFITSTTYAGALGGIDGADIKCRDRAKAAGLAGANKFRAWLSDGLQSPVARFEQQGLTNAPYLQRTGRIVAATFAELVDDGPRTGIAITETGEAVFEELVWTDTTGLGGVLSPVDHCAGWTSANGQLVSHVGFNALALEEGPAWDTWRSERLWTVALTQQCNKLRRLYCFEDGYEPEG